MDNLGIRKIISGGQTGADMGGLIAAKALKIPTGGWAPKGYRTENGPKPSLGLLYGLEETNETDYRPRTMLNVKNSSGTLIFAPQQSRGSVFTQNICKRLYKPYWINPNGEEIEIFITEHEIEILNVAGNRESVSPGIQLYVERLLVRVIGNGRSL